MNRPRGYAAICCLTFVVTVFAGLALKAHRANLSRKAVVEKAVLEVTTQLNDALIKQDLETLSHLTSDDFIWSKGGSGGWLNWDKSRWLDEMKTDSVKFRSITLERIEVAIDGNEASMTGRVRSIVTFSVDRHRSDWPANYPISYRFRRGRDHWQIVSTRYDGAI